MQSPSDVSVQECRAGDFPRRHHSSFCVPPFGFAESCLEKNRPWKRVGSRVAWSTVRWCRAAVVSLLRRVYLTLSSTFVSRLSSSSSITGDHSKWDLRLYQVKIDKYRDFCVYRRSYLLWSSVIVRIEPCVRFRSSSGAILVRQLRYTYPVVIELASSRRVLHWFEVFAQGCVHTTL